MEKDYVTLDQAKVLKEIGFPIFEFHYEDPMFNYYGQFPNFGDVKNNHYYLYPTLSDVHDWLRKDKQIILEIYYSCTFGFWGYNRKVRGKYGYQGLDNHKFNTTGYSTYEEALSVGIDECIKILK